MRKIITLLIASLTLFSCTVEQIYQFNEDGSGEYSIAMDLSEMMKMKGSKSSGNNKNIDTLFNFSKIIEEHKDSISKLPEEERKELMALKPMSFRVKIDTSSTDPQMKMNFNFKFKKLTELTGLGEKLKNVELGKLDKSKKTKMKPLADILKLQDRFESKMNSNEFTFNISEKALAEINKKKPKKAKSNSEKEKEKKNKENPFNKMMKFKQVFKFPYRIKSVSNAKYKISSDFKSIEQDINMVDVENNPKILDVKVEFTK